MYQINKSGAEIEALLNRVGTMSNPNLLHNWYFPRPVNQRGKDIYVGVSETVDRWELDTPNGTIELVSGGVRFSSSNECAYQQKIEAGTLEPTQPYTVSFYVTEITHNGIILIVQRLSDYSTLNSMVIQNGLNTVTFNGDGSMIRVCLYFPAGTPGSVNIVKAKLEPGSVSTLPNDPPPDYGEQLLTCKRFYRLWTTEAARTEALKEVGLMRTSSPTLATISIGGVTYYSASSDL